MIFIIYNRLRLLFSKIFYKKILLFILLLGVECQKLDFQKKSQNLQANEILEASNLNLLSKSASLTENKQNFDAKKTKNNLERLQTKTTTNDENSSKESLSKIGAILNSKHLRKTLSTANSKQAELSDPISPGSSASNSSSISSSTLTSTSTLSSHSNSNSAKIFELLKKEENPGENNDPSLRLKSSEKSDKLENAEQIKREENLRNEPQEDKSAQLLPSILNLKEEKTKSVHEEEIKAEPHLVMDLKEEAYESDPNDEIEFKAEKRELAKSKAFSNLTNELDDTELSAKENFGNDLNNSKSSSSNETFSTLSSKLHSRDKHVCRFCSKSFPRSANLTRHLRTHTGSFFFSILLFANNVNDFETQFQLLLCF